MSKFKAIALAGVCALSMGAAMPANASGCILYGSNTEAEAHLQNVIQYVQNWLNNRPASDPSYAAMTAHLAQAQYELATVEAVLYGGGLPNGKLCKIDVSPS